MTQTPTPVEMLTKEIDGIISRVDCSLPNYLNILLTYEGYDDIVAFYDFTDEDVIKLENFASGDFIDIAREEDVISVYTAVYRARANERINLKQFKILTGHKKLLKEFVKRCIEEKENNVSCTKDRPKRATEGEKSSYKKKRTDSGNNNKQDDSAFCTKMKTRLTKPEVVLPMGKFFVSAKHVQEIIESQSKDKHLLTMNDLNSKCISVVSVSLSIIQIVSAKPAQLCIWAN